MPSRRTKGAAPPSKQKKTRRIGIVGRVGGGLVAIALGIGAAITGWFGDWTKNIMTDACNRVGLPLCPGKSPTPDASWTIVFSSAVPHCETGKIASKFRDWSPPVSWIDGADRLVVCTNAEQRATKADYPERLGAMVPECLSVIRNGDKVSIAARHDRRFICRAPYRFDGTELLESTLAEGWFVCTPGHAHLPAADVFTIGDKQVPACDPEVLRRYRFL
jgi:hypothetical protein